MTVDLSREQVLCESLRRRAPDHTYQNDEQIVLGLKRILDLDMGIPYPDAHDLLNIALRARVGMSMQQQKTILALLLEVLPTRHCEVCKGDGKSRGAYRTLPCEPCLGTGIRFIPPIPMAATRQP